MLELKTLLDQFKRIETLDHPLVIPIYYYSIRIKKTKMMKIQNGQLIPLTQRFSTARLGFILCVNGG